MTRRIPPLRPSRDPATDPLIPVFDPGTRQGKFRIQVNPGAKFTGGTVTFDGDDVIHTFTSSGTLTKIVGDNVDVQYVVGAGGGGGGLRRAAGGGGGGWVAVGITTLSLSSYAITVGAGGAGAVGTSDSNRIGANGGNSSLGSVVSASGGGGGNGGNDLTSGNNGQNGGCGGGAGGGGTSVSRTGGGTGIPGGNGGAGRSSGDPADREGGGGGGAGGNGGDSPYLGTGVGGNGGIPRMTAIRGTIEFFGAGGAGVGGSGTHGTPHPSAQSAGCAVDGGNCDANTCDGGGGGRFVSPAPNGGSGIVIVRYRGLIAS